MPLTLWVLILAAAVTLVVLLRRKMARSSGAAQLAAHRSKSAAEQAENDRRDCLALEQSLRAGAYGDRSQPDAKPRPE